MRIKERLLIVKQILLVSTLGNVWRKVWRTCRLMFGCKVLMTNTLKKYKKILERRRHHFHFLHLLSCSLLLLSNCLIKVSGIYFLTVQTHKVVSMGDLQVCHTWNSSKQNLWLTELNLTKL